MNGALVQAYYEWSRSFKATWPNLLKEPESELVQVDDVRLKAAIAFGQVLAPMVDPKNKIRLLQWAESATNQREELFGGNALQLDFDEMSDWLEKTERQQEMMQQQQGGLAEQERSAKPPPPFSSHDAAAAGVGDATIASLIEARGRGARIGGGGHA